MDIFKIELGRGENLSTQSKTSRSKDENQQQTQATHDAESGNRIRATLVGGECSHHCTIPAPCVAMFTLHRNNVCACVETDPVYCNCRILVNVPCDNSKVTELKKI